MRRTHYGRYQRSLASASWLGAALALHVSVIWYLGWLSSGPVSAVQRASPKVPAAPVEAEVEIAVSTASADAAVIRLARPSTDLGGEPRPSPRGRTSSAVEGFNAGQPASSGPATPEAEAALAEATTPEPESALVQRRLSRNELGIGSSNPFVGKPARERGGREVAIERFQKRMSDDLLRSDRAVSLGPEGPVITALESATRSDNPAPNSSALMRFSTDASGRLLAADLLLSSSDPVPWRRIARQVLADIGTKRLRIPKTGRGVSFDIRVISRIQLPSGADPGLAVNVLGIPLQKGEGPRSARLDILNLNPRLFLDTITLPSGEKEGVPTLGFGSLLLLTKDPADIGAKARRMVRAHVVKLSTSARDTPE